MVSLHPEVYPWGQNLLDYVAIYPVPSTGDVTSPWQTGAHDCVPLEPVTYHSPAALPPYPPASHEFAHALLTPSSDAATPQKAFFHGHAPLLSSLVSHDYLEVRLYSAAYRGYDEIYPLASHACPQAVPYLMASTVASAAPASHGYVVRLS